MRDRDVRLAIQQALIDTGQFDVGAVMLTGIPEDYGSGASKLAAVGIEPMGFIQEDKWDAQPAGDLLVTSKVKITFMQREQDPQLCDEACEALYDTAANALNGESLAGFTIPGHTRFLTGSWQRRKPPERRIESVFSYQYIVSGWNAYDTTP